MITVENLNVKIDYSNILNDINFQIKDNDSYCAMNQLYIF